MEGWKKAVIGLLVAGLAYWAFSGAFWTPWAKASHQATCEDEGIPSSTCACIVDWLGTAGYSPNDVDGEDYNRQAMYGAALACFDL